MTWVAVGSAAVTVVGGYLSSKQKAKADAKTASQYAAAADPYAPYRADAAKRLNDLMANPNSITDTPEYKARMTAAGRTMAAQGYTGSGNALAAAAQAGGDVYQQAFNNLALTSGAGQNPATAAGGSADLSQAAAQSQQSNNNQLLNSGVYWGQKAIAAWNQPTAPSPSPIAGANDPGFNPVKGTW